METTKWNQGKSTANAPALNPYPLSETIKQLQCALLCLYLDLESNSSVNGGTVNVTIPLVKYVHSI